jgi:uncharacterized membrane protein
MAKFSMNPDSNLRSRFRSKLKRYFLSGILVIVPLIITYLVLKFLLGSIDGILSPLLIETFGYRIPGLGIVVLLLIILLVGILTRGVLGRQFLITWEKILVQVPLVRTIYVASKQLLASISEPRELTYQRVVLVAYPSKDIYSFAFAGSEVELDNASDPGNYVAVFVPSTPTPFTGFTVLVKKADVVPIDISVEEAIRFVVSGGIVKPDAWIPPASELKEL